MRQRLAYVASVLGLAAVYVVAARFGLSLDAVAGFATLVWPATGIALAVLVTGRRGVIPASGSGSRSHAISLGRWEASCTWRASSDEAPPPR